jgi:carbonic anhydrase/acetyltransferase-like protein (isoleucine patch superfamily)
LTVKNEVHHVDIDEELIVGQNTRDFDLAHVGRGRTVRRIRTV